MTTAIQLTDPFDESCLLIILLQLSSVTSSFDVFSPSIAECENKEISTIHLTTEKLPWDPSTEEYSERETCILDHKSQISITATSTRGPVSVSAVILYTLAYDASGVIDSDNFVTALSAQIQVRIALIDMVRKPSVELLVFAKRWGITPEKAQKTIQATTQREIRSMLHPSLSRWFQTNNRNLTEIFIIIVWCILYFLIWCLPVQCPEGATNVLKYMPQTLDEPELSNWNLEWSTWDLVIAVCTEQCPTSLSLWQC